MGLTEDEEDKNIGKKKIHGNKKDDRNSKRKRTRIDPVREETKDHCSLRRFLQQLS